MNYHKHIEGVVRDKKEIDELFERGVMCLSINDPVRQLGVLYMDFCEEPEPGLARRAEAILNMSSRFDDKKHLPVAHIMQLRTAKLTKNREYMAWCITDALLEHKYDIDVLSEARSLARYVPGIGRLDPNLIFG